MGAGSPTALTTLSKEGASSEQTGSFAL